MSLSLADFFVGKMEQREYSGEFDFEFIPQYSTVDGVQRCVGYQRNLVTYRTVEQEFRFRGVPPSLIDNTGSVTVTDVGGAQYTFNTKSSWTDGSSGSRVMEVDSVNVSRIRTSPHTREMVVVRRGTRYWLNGTLLSMTGEPSGWWAANLF